MKLQGFQIYDDANTAYSAKGESFMAGGVVGYFIEAGGLYLLLEGGYAVRDFPSLDWNEDTLPVDIPRELSVSGWSVGAGIQFPVSGS